MLSQIDLVPELTRVVIGANRAGSSGHGGRVAEAETPYGAHANGVERHRLFFVDNQNRQKNVEVPDHPEMLTQASHSVIADPGAEFVLLDLCR